MTIATIHLPNANKTQALDAELVSNDVKNILKQLSSMTFQTYDDYACIPNEVNDYIEELECSKEIYMHANIAIAIFLNNASCQFELSEINEITDDFESEGFKISHNTKTGWLPVLDFGYNTFTVLNA